MTDSKIIKVRITKDTGNTWYKLNDIVEVVFPPTLKESSSSKEIVPCYLEKDSTRTWVLCEHCEVIPPTLQEQLQEAKNNVEAIEKLLAEEANKPFSREDYERIVAQYRACAGRKVFEYRYENFCVEMFQDTIGVDSYETGGTSAMFNVWFTNEDSAYSAIEKVGAINLEKAWQFEMSIGL